MDMNLIAFLTRKNVVNQPVRIGAYEGSGFIRCGRNNDKFRHQVKDMHGRRVMAFSESVYGGWIVLVEGKEAGNDWLNPALEVKPDDSGVTDLQYQRFADTICAQFAEMLRDGIIKTIRAPRDYERIKGEYMIQTSESFFRSDTFAVLMPSADGEDIIALIHERVCKLMKG